VAFTLRFTSEAKAALEFLEGNAAHAPRLRKARKALALLETDPRHPGLHSHRYESLAGPSGERVRESYIENRTPTAWRLWWWYGPGKDEITVLAIGPHPD
jgi:hypothetical protein